jgi:hypothetical protein
MKTANAIDAARVEQLLAELRLPPVKLVWADLAHRPTRKDGRRPASRPR